MNFTLNKEEVYDQIFRFSDSERNKVREALYAFVYKAVDLMRVNASVRIEAMKETWKTQTFPGMYEKVATEIGHAALKGKEELSIKQKTAILRTVRPLREKKRAQALKTLNEFPAPQQIVDKELDTWKQISCEMIYTSTFDITYTALRDLVLYLRARKDIAKFLMSDLVKEYKLDIEIKLASVKKKLEDKIIAGAAEAQNLLYSKIDETSSLLTQDFVFGDV
jgi:hypothetical protein